MSELQELQEVKSKIELAKRKQDAMVMQQIVEPLAEAIEELSSTILEIKNIKPEPTPDYFDKDFNLKLIESVNKVFSLLQKFKQPDIKVDLSPINNIATEIKNQNSNIIALINKSNNGQNEQLQRLIVAMVEKQNLFLDREFKQMDYSEQLNSINETLNKKNDKVEKLTVVRGEFNLIKEVIPIYKNKI